jgi:hypothetical protein
MLGIYPNTVNSYYICISDAFNQPATQNEIRGVQEGQVGSAWLLHAFSWQKQKFLAYCSSLGQISILPYDTNVPGQVLSGILWHAGQTLKSPHGSAMDYDYLHAVGVTNRSQAIICYLS